MKRPSATLVDLGEFGTIARIREWLGAAQEQADPSVRVGLGDDVAVTLPPRDRELLLTCDVQVAGRHFVPAWMTPEEVGRRALEVNLSDIAAKGGTVLWVLVSLGLPPEFLVDDLEQIYRGILAGLDRAGSGTVVGGNLTSSSADQWFIDMTVIGSTEIDGAAERRGAQVGDRVFVTGYPGSASAGLAVLQALAGEEGSGTLGSRVDLRRRVSGPDSPVSGWIRAYLEPRSRLALGRALVAGKHIHAMLDVSDGILGDLFHLCEASSVASTLDLASLSFPRFDLPGLVQLGVETKDSPWRWILGPSDDYELLFAGPADERDAILALGEAHGIPVREIGEIHPGRPNISIHGKEVGLPDRDWTPSSSSGGWDHFEPT